MSIEYEEETLRCMLWMTAILCSHPERFSEDNNHPHQMAWYIQTKPTTFVRDFDMSRNNNLCLGAPKPPPPPSPHPTQPPPHARIFWLFNAMQSFPKLTQKHFIWRYDNEHWSGQLNLFVYRLQSRFLIWRKFFVSLNCHEWMSWTVMCTRSCGPFSTPNCNLHCCVYQDLISKDTGHLSFLICAFQGTPDKCLPLQPVRRSRASSEGCSPSSPVTVRQSLRWRLPSPGSATSSLFREDSFSPLVIIAPSFCLFFLLFSFLIHSFSSFQNYFFVNHFMYMFVHFFLHMLSSVTAKQGAGCTS